jgi:hypothetical protein
MLPHEPYELGLWNQEEIKPFLSPGGCSMQKVVGREARAERTHNEALAVVERERSMRVQKTERLRELRIAEEAKARPVEREKSD